MRVIVDGIKRKLDESYRKRPRPEHGRSFKTHSITTNMAISNFVFAYIMFSMRNSQLFENSVMTTVIYIGAIGLFAASILLAIGSIYEWGYYFHLRREGLNDDRNMFFDESAGTYRKIAYLVSLFSFSVLLFISYLGYGGLISKRLFSVIILLAFTAFVLENMRSYVKWSYRKHFVILGLALLLIVFFTLPL